MTKIKSEEKRKLETTKQRENILGSMHFFEHTDISDFPHEWVVHFEGSIYRGWAEHAHKCFFAARSKLQSLKYEKERSIAK